MQACHKPIDYQLRGLEPWMKERIQRWRLEALEYELSRPGPTQNVIRRFEPWPEDVPAYVPVMEREP